MAGDVNLVKIILQIPRSRWFWLIVGLLCFFILIKTRQPFIAFSLLTLIVLVLLIPATIKAYQYDTKNREGFLFASICCSIALLFFVALALIEGRAKTPTTEPLPVQPPPAIEQPLPSSSNQTSSNQTSP